MSEREVLAVSKSEGRVTAIAGDFGVRSKGAATIDIQNGAHTYYIVVGGERRPVIVVPTDDGRLLRTVEDPAGADPLLELPETAGPA